jgi:hypothetical protein
MTHFHQYWRALFLASATMCFGERHGEQPTR